MILWVLSHVRVRGFGWSVKISLRSVRVKTDKELVQQILPPFRWFTCFLICEEKLMERFVDVVYNGMTSNWCFHSRKSITCLVVWSLNFNIYFSQINIYLHFIYIVDRCHNGIKINRKNAYPEKSMEWEKINLQLKWKVKNREFCLFRNMFQWQTRNRDEIEARITSLIYMSI